jgi:phospholipid/cholesterol/gamma-HCH transport system permease protein
MNTSAYVLRAIKAAKIGDLYSGLTKSAVFAWLVVTIACHAGLKVEGGAEASGRRRLIPWFIHCLPSS